GCRRGHPLHLRGGPARGMTVPPYLSRAARTPRRAARLCSPAASSGRRRRRPGPLLPPPAHPLSRTLLLGVLLSVAAAPAALAQPDPDAAPSAGTVTLAAGFSPDPHAVDLMAGGPVEAADADPTCAGYVGAAPSVALDYGGGGTLHLFVRSSSDTVLLVRTPGGDWLCNDDEEALNPGLRVEDAESGRYAVWVGTFSDTASADTPATLYVSAREAP